MNLYVNSKGDSVLANWTRSELLQGFETAERDGDDFFWGHLTREWERRYGIPEQGEGHICGDRSDP